jgi:Tol biopolymer transport system component
MAVELVDKRRLTWGHANHEHPVISPDGKRVAFYAGEYGWLQLYVTSADGTNQRPLTVARGNHTQAAWSPDGVWLYYRRQDAGELPWSIWRLRVDDPDDKQCLLGDKKVSFKHPSPSPDGKTLAWFSDQGTPGNFHVFVAPLGKQGLGKARRLTSDPNRNDCHPTWSPDGKRLTFHAYMGKVEATISHIYVMDVDGGTPRQITHAEAFHKHPFFIGAGHVLHHTEEPDGRRYLVVRKVDGTHVADLTSGKKNDKHPSPWLPAHGGPRIVFSSKKRGEEHEGEGHTYDVFMGTIRGLRVVRR